jgi:hypothetical protein
VDAHICEALAAASVPFFIHAAANKKYDRTHPKNRDGYGRYKP